MDDSPAAAGAAGSGRYRTTDGWAGSWAGRLAVLGTATLAIGGFTLSFAALRDLAVRVGMPADLGWIWPLLIDGMIVEATLAVVVLARRGVRSVWYAWVLLAVGAVVSVGSNGIHALITGHGWAGAAASSVPPVVLLATTHLTVLLLETSEDAPARRALPSLSDGEQSGEAGHPGSAPDAPAGAVESEIIQEHHQELDAAPAEDASSTAVAPLLAASRQEGCTSPTTDEVRREGAMSEEELRAWVSEQERAGLRVTGAMVAERLGCSASTGRRRLASLRKVREQPRLRLASNAHN